MRRHRRFEFFVGEYLRKQGYTDVDVTPGVADWGVDAFCKKNGKKYAVQAKMYGDCKTQVNRRQMMELYGVMHFFDCQGAIMIYNGRIMENALKVAKKLDIQVVYLDQHLMDEAYSEADRMESESTFDTVWNEISKLAGKTITNSRGTSYQIASVTDGDITYINKAGHQMREKADLFRQIVGYICRYGSIQQCQMRGEFGTYASAFIATVFAQISYCKVTPNPSTIRFSTQNHI